MLAFFMTSLMKTRGGGGGGGGDITDHFKKKSSSFSFLFSFSCDFQTLIFKKRNEKSNEKLQLKKCSY